MRGKYGFNSGIELPSQSRTAERNPLDLAALKEAVRAGNELGFVDRDPPARRKPGRSAQSRKTKFRSQGRSVLLTSIVISVLSRMSLFGGAWRFF